jgi:predicted DNA-binding transcriptional regulator YafY
MKKVTFSVNGKIYEVELENDFAMFVLDKLEEANISPEKNSDIPKLLNIYLQALKQNYDTQKEIEELLIKTSI